MDRNPQGKEMRKEYSKLRDLMRKWVKVGNWDGAIRDERWRVQLFGKVETRGNGGFELSRRMTRHLNAK